MKTQPPERWLPVQQFHCPVSGADPFRPRFSFCGTEFGRCCFCPWRLSGVRCACGYEAKRDSCACLRAFVGGLWRCGDSAGICSDCARLGVFSDKSDFLAASAVGIVSCDFCSISHSPLQAVEFRLKESRFYKT